MNSDKRIIGAKDLGLGRLLLIIHGGRCFQVFGKNLDFDFDSSMAHIEAKGDFGISGISKRTATEPITITGNKEKINKFFGKLGYVFLE